MDERHQPWKGVCHRILFIPGSRKGKANRRPGGRDQWLPRVGCHREGAPETSHVLTRLRVTRVHLYLNGADTQPESKVSAVGQLRATWRWSALVPSSGSSPDREPLGPDSGACTWVCGPTVREDTGWEQ